MSRFLRTLLLLSMIAGAALASAKPPFLKIFMAAYNIDPNSAIGKARCLNCHLPPGPPRRNPYGLAVQEALETAHQRMVSIDILKGIESKSAGDGLTFIQKIKKDIPPGQLMPKPVTATKKAAKKQTKSKASAKSHHKAQARKKHAAKKRLSFLPDAPTWTAVLLCLAPLAFVARRRF